MRVFRRYWIKPGRGKEYRSMGNYLEYYSAPMRGYKIDDSYKNKQMFLDKWFHGRYPSYDSFIRKFISKNENILSLACGRCINELKLIEEGYSITCSDLEVPSCYIPSKDLFGEFEFERLDILEGCPSRRYEKIICIGLIWAFNEDEMDIFFKNVYQGLESKGVLILELSVSPDNLLSFFFHDIYLRLESNALRMITSVFGKSYKRIMDIHGYRYKTKEIIQIASQNHFEMVDLLACEPLVEFQRSPLLGRLIDKSSLIRKIMSIIGMCIPYSRLFALKRI